MYRAFGSITRVESGDRKALFVASTEARDRHNSIVKIEAWKKRLQRFNDNGIIAYQHHVSSGWFDANPYDPDYIIGTGHAYIEGDKLMCEVKFQKGETNPLAQKIWDKIQEDVLKGTYKKFPHTTCAVYEMTISTRQYEKITRMIHLFQKKDRNTIYNLLGVLGVAFKEPFEPHGSYFCSQFVAEILHRAGVRLWDKLPALVEPDDFRRSDQTTLIYEGLLTDYEPVLIRRKAE